MEHVITRTMYCPYCGKRSRPQKGDSFVVFGTTSQCLMPRKSHRWGVRGFTPHLILWEEPLIVMDGLVCVTVCCAMENCGIHIKDGSTKKQAYVDWLRAEYCYLTERDFAALMYKFKNTGYEIF